MRGEFLSQPFCGVVEERDLTGLGSAVGRAREVWQALNEQGKSVKGADILVIGVAYGSIAGFVGGKLDNGMMRFLDALYGLPYLPFAIIALAIIGNSGFWTLVVALSIASWFTTARIVRSAVSRSCEPIVRYDCFSSATSSAWHGPAIMSWCVLGTW